MGEKLLTMRQLSERTGRPLSTLRFWRTSWPDGDRRGPEPLEIEGRIQYAESAVDAWLKAKISEAQAANQATAGR